MFDKPSPELDEATAMGVSLFAGEAEEGIPRRMIVDRGHGGER